MTSLQNKCAALWLRETECAPHPPQASKPNGFHGNIPPTALDARKGTVRKACSPNRPPKQITRRECTVKYEVEQHPNWHCKCPFSPTLATGAGNHYPE